MQKEKKWKIGLLATIWSLSTSQPIPQPSVQENNQHTGYCHSHRQHPEDCQKRSQWAALRQWPQTCNLGPCQACQHQCRKNAYQLELQEGRLKELQGTNWHQHQVDHLLQASNTHSAVLKAAKESIPRKSTRNWVKPDRKIRRTQLNSTWEDIPSWRLI